jgi:hypothetical protein
MTLTVLDFTRALADFRGELGTVSRLYLDRASEDSFRASLERSAKKNVSYNIEYYWKMEIENTTL